MCKNDANDPISVGPSNEGIWEIAIGENQTQALAASHAFIVRNCAQKGLHLDTQCFALTTVLQASSAHKTCQRTVLVGGLARDSVLGRLSCHMLKPFSSTGIFQVARG